MEISELLDHFPLWVLLLITVGVIFLSVEIGYRLGGYRKLRSKEEKESSVSTMVGATLGLLAFMLSFTFGLSASRFNDRRLVILDEANAIGTTYLRAKMLPQPLVTDTRNLLREYVDARLESVQPGKSDQAILKSKQLQDRMWSQAVAAAEIDRSDITALFVLSLNDVIDLHSKRVLVGLRSRVPGGLWVTLYLLAILGMAAMGYMEGLISIERSPTMLALVFAFSLVLVLIVDLDRPGEGLLRISQQTMIDLRNSMSDTGSAQGIINP